MFIPYDFIKDRRFYGWLYPRDNWHDGTEGLTVWIK